MRKLLYVPIIHDPSDLGSLGPILEKASSSYLGERRWARHRETVDAFWKTIDGFLASLDARTLKVYQDGLAAEGELGRKVVQEAARRGSNNHRILLALVKRGAEIRKTEDVGLLLEEGRHLLETTKGGSEGRASSDRVEYHQEQYRLTHRRDSFVAERINETLKQGENGILFMGADHDVLSRLAEDIGVVSVKEREKVRAYFQELLLGHDEEKLELLAGYLASPIQDL